jgi:small subunit ribosomal protein S3Ae
MAEKEAPAKKATLARTVKDKWRAKQWFKVRAPGLFQHVELGETMANEPAQIVGRTMSVTLPELSGAAEVGKAHIKLTFRIARVTGENVAEAEFVGHELTTDYVRRLARRKRSKIDASLKVTTKDGVAIILKPVAVGELRLQTRLRAELRHKLNEILIREAQQKTAPEFVRDMLQGELAKVISHGVRTLYPLKKIEMRRSVVLGSIADESPVPETPATVVPEAVTPPSEPSGAPQTGEVTSS